MYISLTDTNGTYSITLNEDFVTLEEIIALLVKPILLAASFSEEQLDKYFVKEEDEFEIIFEGWTDEEEEEDWEDDEPMEKVVCKKVVAVAPKVAAEKKAVAKMATARMAGG